MGLSAILRRIAAAAASSSSVTGLTVGRHGRILMGSEISYYCSSAILSNSTTTPLDKKKKKKKDILSCALFGTRVCSDLSSSIAQVNQSILDSKSRCLREEEDDQEERSLKVPDDFTFGIDYQLGKDTILLEKKCSGEVVKVQVYRPWSYGQLSLGEDDIEDSKCKPMRLIVTIYKRNEKCLEFHCTMNPVFISIGKMLVKDPDDPANDKPYFQDLDWNLQEAFYKYLEVRGIKPSISKFLYQLLAKKDSIERSRWRKQIKDFL